VEKRSFLGRLLWLLSGVDGRNWDLLINDFVIILERFSRRSVVKFLKKPWSLKHQQTEFKF
jgi:hypothetical protein